MGCVNTSPISACLKLVFQLKSIDSFEEMSSKSREKWTANTKAKGTQIGRPHTTKDDIPALFLKHYPAYKNGQLNVSELARVCNLSRTTTYKYIGLLEH